MAREPLATRRRLMPGEGLQQDLERAHDDLARGRTTFRTQTTAPALADLETGQVIFTADFAYTVVGGVLKKWALTNA